MSGAPTDAAREGALRKPGGELAGHTFPYLSGADLEALGLGMADVIEAVDEACRAKGRGHAVTPPKTSLHGEEGAFSQVMAASLGDRGLGVKWVTIFPANAATGRPTVNGLVIVSDPRTGEVAGVLEAGAITAWRTGAGVGVAARYLARRDTQVAGVLGCGVQGRSSALALAAELPELREVRCFDVASQAMDALAARLAQVAPRIHVVTCGAPTQVPAGAGVVVSAVTMIEGVAPPLGAGLLEPGALAVALDYDAAWTAAAMAACDRFFCDDTGQVLATKAAGVRLRAIPDAISGDLGELAVGRVPGRLDDRERLFCLNLGMAIEDIATARLALERAHALGVGRALPA